MKTLLISILIIGLGIFGMCFNIIFRKNGELPETEFSRNKEMRKLGIKCMNEIERERLGCAGHDRKAACNGGEEGSACASCSFRDSGLGKVGRNNK